MSNIFPIRPGFAMAVRDGNAAPLTLEFDGWGDIASGGAFAERKAIVMGVSMSRQANVQFLHTLNGFVYVYVFGERIGDMVLTGLSFTGRCPSDTANGLDAVHEYYNEHGVAFAEDPVGVQIGATAFTAFLIGTKLQIVDPKAALAQFQFFFKFVQPNIPAFSGTQEPLEAPPVTISGSQSSPGTL